MYGRIAAVIAALYMPCEAAISYQVIVDPHSQQHAVVEEARVVELLAPLLKKGVVPVRVGGGYRLYLNHKVMFKEDKADRLSDSGIALLKDCARFFTLFPSTQLRMGPVVTKKIQSESNTLEPLSHEAKAWEQSRELAKQMDAFFSGTSIMFKAFSVAELMNLNTDFHAEFESITVIEIED